MSPGDLKNGTMLPEDQTVIDLFCGCGGLSWGLKCAGLHVIAGVDNDEAALSTFKTNFPDAQPLHIDLTDAAIEDLGRKFGSREIDVIVGGPPCQGFSKNVPRTRRFLDDPKNVLVRTFMHAVEILQPKVVLMENVAEMTRAFDGTFTTEIMERFNKAGYAATATIHNAIDFGIPQRRRRVFFFANRVGMPIPELKTTVENHTSQEEAQLGPETARPITVWNAIGDLAPVRGKRARPNCYNSPPFSEYQALMRRFPGPLTDHEERTLSTVQQARYDALEPGQGLRDLPSALQTKGGYSGAYGRLTKDMLAPTITRWVFHPGSGRFGHPVERRLLTIREAARIQSFTDNFVFFGSNHQKSWQIGNAVPPLLAEQIAVFIKLTLSLNYHALASSTLPQQLELL